MLVPIASKRGLQAPIQGKEVFTPEGNYREVCCMYKLVKKFKGVDGNVHTKEKTYEVSRKDILKVFRQACKK